MHGLEGNKIFAALLFGVFIALGVVFVPRILGETEHLIGFVTGHPHKEHELCDPETGKHAIIPGLCLVPESPKPQPPEQPFLLLLAAADGSAAAGLTQKTCGGCHIFEETGPAKAGPSLWNSVAEPVGGKAGYAYSSALAGKEGDWSYEQLNGFLQAPAGWVPGTKMSYAGQADPAKRALYVAYLRTLSASPAPLPEQAELDALKAEYDAAFAQYEADLEAWENGE